MTLTPSGRKRENKSKNREREEREGERMEEVVSRQDGQIAQEEINNASGEEGPRHFVARRHKNPRLA